MLMVESRCFRENLEAIKEADVLESLGGVRRGEG